MIYFFDILLLIPVFFMFFLVYADKNEKSFILGLCGVSISLFLLRRFSCSLSALICLIVTFFACILIKKLYIYFSKNEYVVISVDCHNNMYLLSDGKSIKSIIYNGNPKYKVGEIVRITTNFD